MGLTEVLIETQDKMDKDRFSGDPGGLIEAYREVARRLGLFIDTPSGDGSGPVLVTSK